MSGTTFVFLFLGILILGGYWIFGLMPRQRDFRKRQETVRSLVEGEEVITGGGIVGRIRRIDADKGVAWVELADDLEVRVLTAAIIDRYNPEEIAKNVRMSGVVDSEEESVEVKA